MKRPLNPVEWTYLVAGTGMVLTALLADVLGGLQKSPATGFGMLAALFCFVFICIATMHVAAEAADVARTWNPQQSTHLVLSPLLKGIVLILRWVYLGVYVAALRTFSHSVRVAPANRIET